MKVSVLITFSILVIFSSKVFSSDVLYCSETESVGFSKSGNGEWSLGRFEQTRFSMKFSDDTFSYLRINHRNRNEGYICRDEDPYPPVRSLNCIQEGNTGPYTFLYSVDTKRFTWFRGTLYSYPLDLPDSTSISIGTCENF